MKDDRRAVMQIMASKKALKVLAIDVGGSHVKTLLSGRSDVRAFESGPTMTPQEMVSQVLKLNADLRYDVVSIGYPGVVMRGRIMVEPYNLGHGWAGFDFLHAFGKPTHVMNDAAMQALGSYEGGRMLFLGLGTGLGSTLIVDDVIAPMELAHLPYKHGKTYEDFVGEHARRKLGTKKWRHVVAAVVEQLATALEAEYVVLGGGNARKLKKLPKNVELGENEFAFTGGFRVWAKDGIAHRRERERRPALR
jgi:polyphosphate glucokinase